MIRVSSIPRIIQIYSEDCSHFTENFIRIILPILQYLTQTATQDGGLQLTERQKIFSELVE